MTALSNLSDAEILLIVGDKWPAMTTALIRFSDHRKCQHRRLAARKLLEQFIVKNNLKG